MTIFTPAGFDHFVRSLAATTLHDQWDSRVAKVGDRIFAVHAAPAGERASLAFKCSRQAFEVLTQGEGVDQAPYFARGQWVRVASTATLDEDEIRLRLAASYRLVALTLSRKKRDELGIELQ